MALNGVKRFKMVMRERIQLILGTNGSGKSSLMKELSPLPANPAAYSKNGSKTISITHKGSDYLLVSDFSKPKPHSFMKDGEELNEGGTITFQKDLVWKYFQYDQDIHDLLTGLERFTEMPIPRRREWLTKLCVTNFDYAIATYNKIRERSRDVTGALKLAKKRLVMEIAKVASPEEISKIQTEIDNLLKDINALYGSRSDERRTPDDVENEQRRIEIELSDLSNRLFAVKALFAGREIMHPEQMQQVITQTREEIAANAALTDQFTKEHASLKETLDAYVKSGASDLSELNQRVHALAQKKFDLENSEKLKLVFSDPIQASAALQSVYESLFACFSSLPENKDRRFSYPNLQTAREKEITIKQKLQEANTRLERLRHREEHLKNLKQGDMTRCPKCSHTWILGYSEDEEIKVITTIAQGVEFVKKQEEELKAVQELIVTNTEYGDKLREYTRCVNALPVLAPFWNYLNDGEIVQDYPRFALTQLESLRSDLLLQQQALDLNKEIQSTHDRIQLAVKASNMDMSKTSTRIEQCEEQLGKLAIQARTLQTKLSQSQHDLNRINELLELSGKIQRCMQLMETGVDDMVRAIRNEIINRTLNQLQLDVAEKQRVLNDIGMQKGIVKDLENNIEILTREETVYKMLVSALSPTDGLIAEGLLGFIRNYVRKMNVVIKRIWTYSMEVKDCSSDSEGSADLDYKFPIIVQGNEDDPVDDVKNGSTGMKEIINLSFKVVAMHYLGMDEYPLMLDEFGAGFDDAHRVNAGATIKLLMEQHAFSQLFMISHYASTHGSFTNAEIAVICGTNIMLPTKDKYNTHVEMQ